MSERIAFLRDSVATSEMTVGRSNQMSERRYGVDHLSFVRPTTMRRFLQETISQVNVEENIEKGVDGLVALEGIDMGHVCASLGRWGLYSPSSEAPVCGVCERGLSPVFFMCESGVRVLACW